MKNHWITLTINSLWILATILFAASSSATAPNSNTTSIPNQSWFEPELMENNSPFCEKALTNARKAFFDTDFTNRYTPHNDDVLIEGAYSTPKVDLVSIKGSTVYVRIMVTRGCGGACEGAQVVATKTPIENTTYTDDLDNSLIAKMPPGTSPDETLFIKTEEENYYAITINESILVHQLQPDASFSKACEIKIAPSEENYANNETATQLKSASERLGNALQPIMGSYGSCGSSAAGWRNKMLLEKLLKNLSVRPWASTKSWIKPTNTYDYLEKWSAQGIHQFNSYKIFKAERDSIIPIITKQYTQLFGWSEKDAEKTAKSAIDNLIAATVGQANPTEQKERQQIARALLENADLSTIKSFATNLKTLNPAYTDGYGEYYDPLIVAAIANPEALQYLLDQGLNPNEPNPFDKTPLMYAAQYNQLKSASILLDHGADPNAKTIIPEDTCQYTLSKSGMRALHYAVRYSSPELIKLLLDRGADPMVTTSEKTGGYPFDWLKKYTAPTEPEVNLNIPAAEIATLEKLLALPSPEEKAKQVLNFNIKAEKAYADNKLQEAYEITQKALKLEPTNERALSNLGLIALKLGKTGIALRTTRTLITQGTNKKLIANAWHNYDAACDAEKPNPDHGEGHCQSSKIYNYFFAYINDPSETRRKRLFDVCSGIVNLAT